MGFKELRSYECFQITMIVCDEGITLSVLQSVSQGLWVIRRNKKNSDKA